VYNFPPVSPRIESCAHSNEKLLLKTLVSTDFAQRSESANIEIVQFHTLLYPGFFSLIRSNSLSLCSSQEFNFLSLIICRQERRIKTNYRNTLLDLRLKAPRDQINKTIFILVFIYLFIFYFYFYFFNLFFIFEMLNTPSHSLILQKVNVLIPYIHDVSKVF